MLAVGVPLVVSSVEDNGRVAACASSSALELAAIIAMPLALRRAGRSALVSHSRTRVRYANQCGDHRPYADSCSRGP